VAATIRAWHSGRRQARTWRGPTATSSPTPTGFIARGWRRGSLCRRFGPGGPDRSHDPSPDVASSRYGLLKESGRVFREAENMGIDPDESARARASQPGVVEVTTCTWGGHLRLPAPVGERRGERGRRLPRTAEQLQRVVSSDCGILHTSCRSTTEAATRARWQIEVTPGAEHQAGSYNRPQCGSLKPGTRSRDGARIVGGAEHSQLTGGRTQHLMGRVRVPRGRGRAPLTREIARANLHAARGRAQSCEGDHLEDALEVEPGAMIYVLSERHPRGRERSLRLETRRTK